ncbi:MAG: SH3 domain-containing protein, partial [Thermoanaerobaculia bacterium]
FILLLVLLVATAGSLFVHRLFPLQVAVVVPQEIEARTAPDPDSVVRFKLHAGTEVQVKDRRPGWLRIVLPDGQQGWVEEEWTELVEG